jgi:peptide/nickel transport system permease protein
MNGSLPVTISKRLVALAATVVLAPTVTYAIFGGLSGTLGEPLPTAVWHYVVRTFWHLDLGRSATYQGPMSDVLRWALPMDLALIGGGILCGIALGVFGGVTVVARRGTRTAAALQVASAVLLASPPYLLGFALLILFAPGTGYLLQIPFFSKAEIYGETPTTVLGWLRELWLPWLLVGLPLAAQVLRMTASGVREALTEDFVRTATAKGVSPARVLRRHAGPPSYAATVSFVGVSVPLLVTNMVLVERVLSVPGFFRYTWRAIGHFRFNEVALPDYTMLCALTLWATVLIIVLGLLADAVLGRIDPRVRDAAF